MIKVLFVCLGNICRSPMAEGSFQKLIADKKLHNKVSCDSAGTSSYHIGEFPDERMCKTAAKYDIMLNHRARQLVKEDFKTFDYIIAMDEKNYHNIKKLADSGGETPRSYKVFMMREFDSMKDHHDVPDPYFGGIDGFEEVYSILTRSNKNFMDFLIKEHNL
ncbi:MAG: low molecular weight phosphotyrosine protein phosphatase [Cytophagaceae bacterium]|nr:low molecular weight phosphotyrosine protein phosphatase [Cytophagaceae bacterium]